MTFNIPHGEAAPSTRTPVRTHKRAGKVAPAPHLGSSKGREGPGPHRLPPPEPGVRRRHCAPHAGSSGRTPRPGGGPPPWYPARPLSRWRPGGRALSVVTLPVWPTREPGGTRSCSPVSTGLRGFPGSPTPPLLICACPPLTRRDSQAPAYQVLTASVTLSQNGIVGNTLRRE